ncbi:hypothetical protein DFJ77DRAFT_443926 [Powellomyces hirtus]|nr:hypothetical protein DFJ77DRAFT_443926 [Powellomyces hirtus]
MTSVTCRIYLRKGVPTRACPQSHALAYNAKKILGTGRILARAEDLKKRSKKAIRNPMTSVTCRIYLRKGVPTRACPQSHALAYNALSADCAPNVHARKKILGTGRILARAEDLKKRSKKTIRDPMTSVTCRIYLRKAFDCAPNVHARKKIGNGEETSKQRKKERWERMEMNPEDVEFVECSPVEKEASAVRAGEEREKGDARQAAIYKNFGASSAVGQLVDVAVEARRALANHWLVSFLGMMYTRERKVGARQGKKVPFWQKKGENFLGEAKGRSCRHMGTKTVNIEALWRTRLKNTLFGVWEQNSLVSRRAKTRCEYGGDMGVWERDICVWEHMKVYSRVYKEEARTRVNDKGDKWRVVLAAVEEWMVVGKWGGGVGIERECIGVCLQQEVWVLRVEDGVERYGTRFGLERGAWMAGRLNTVQAVRGVEEGWKIRGGVAQCDGKVFGRAKPQPQCWCVQREVISRDKGRRVWGKESGRDPRPICKKKGAWEEISHRACVKAWGGNACATSSSLLWLPPCSPGTRGGVNDIRTVWEYGCALPRVGSIAQGGRTSHAVPPPSSGMGSERTDGRRGQRERQFDA